MEYFSPWKVASSSSALEESESLMQITYLSGIRETMCMTEVKPEERHEHRVEKRKFSEGTGEQFRMLKRPCRDHIVQIKNGKVCENGLGMALLSPAKATSVSSLSEKLKFVKQLASLTCSFETMCKLEVKSEERHESTEQRATKRKYTRDIGEPLRSSKRQCVDLIGTSGSSGDNNDDPVAPAEQINKHLNLSASLQHLDAYPSMLIERPKLVLDLDHTLLNTTQLMNLSFDESHLIYLTSIKKDIGLLHRVDFEDTIRLVKLRPFVHQFLEEVNKMFDLYIYTMGTQTYAEEVVKLLDPENKYFPSKVIARADHSRRVQKSLSVVPASKASTIIVDDKSRVWKEEDQKNVLQIERYNYFSSSYRACHSTSKSLAELRIDESSANGNLAAILSVLKRAHMRFKMDQLRGMRPDFERILENIR